MTSRAHRRTAPRPLLRAAACVLAMLCCAAPARAQQVDAAKAARIKAAYLLNFVRYTQWPAESFAAPDSPIVISIVGHCEAADVLVEAAPQTDAVGGRKLEIELMPAPAEPDASAEAWASLYDRLKSSHLVYLCGLEPKRVEQVLHGLGAPGESLDKLTVGDGPSFAARGGMLGFVLRDGRILFEANLEVIRKSRVEVSAKVLQLAQIVGGAKP